jgi:DNA-binding NarL/FixJ family response regulator
LIEEQFVRDRKLSTRELEVLQWLARGKSNTDIAEIIGASATTVDTYVRRLFAKLAVNNRIAAVVAALTAGLITL